MISALVISCLLQAARLASALDFNSSTTCNAACKGAANLGATFEASQHADPSMSFYTVPSNFSRTLAPGTVLAVEYATNLTNYLVPSSLTMSRILYTTTDLNGTIQPASAYIMWPYMPAPYSKSDKNSSGFPLVAWAHGTSGNLATCAPSNYKALQYHFMVPFALAMEGIAVVAPDYAGLGVGSLPDGTPVGHAYGAAPAQANDLANAILAARAAFPGEFPASGPFVAAGHSQGGAVAWAFAERQTTQPVAGYRGTFAFAPAARPITWIERARAHLANGTAVTSDYTALSTQNKLIAGITAAYPAYNYSGLTPTTYDRYLNVLVPAGGCLPTDNLVLADVPITELARDGWTADPTVRQFVNQTEVGGRAFAGPLLVLVGEQDRTPITPANVGEVVDETCAVLEKTHSKEELEYVVFPAADHFPLIQASHSKWMGWVREHLLAGGNKGCKSKQVAGARCKKSKANGFRTEFTVQSVTPNWLVTGVPAMEAWKYSL